MLEIIITASDDCTQEEADKLFAIFEIARELEKGDNVDFEQRGDGFNIHKNGL